MGVVAVPAASAKPKGGRKKCPKGYVVKTVTKHGKKVKVCRKAHGKGKGTGTPTPAPTPPAPAAGLFEAPGKKLEGEAAKPFLEKYLANSTFTSCPAGWPNCGGFEDRYSHGPGSTFHKCILRPTSGSDIIVTDSYGLEAAVVEPDGSWTFREVVYDYGHYPHYEWHVSTTGVVEGAYQYENGPIEKIGPLQYLAGAKDCSY
ncbi:MAG TPA: hypothetical protein VMH33_00155 [Solirubrobacterales bacterium]|nr:hypothetical protein [Solirubrobacterales bacterium]